MSNLSLPIHNNYELRSMIIQIIYEQKDESFTLDSIVSTVSGRVLPSHFKEQGYCPLSPTNEAYMITPNRVYIKSCVESIITDFIKTGQVAQINNFYYVLK